MKVIILLALAAFAVSQPQNELNHLINTEVHEIIDEGGEDITVEECTTLCDAEFDLTGGHDEELTDRLCHEDCARQLHEGPVGPEGRSSPPPHPSPPQ